MAISEETVPAGEVVKVRKPLQDPGSLGGKGAVNNFLFQSLVIAFLATVSVGGYFWWRSTTEYGVKVETLSRSRAELDRDFKTVMSTFEGIAYYREPFYASPDFEAGYLYVNPNVYSVDNAEQLIAHVENIGWVKVKLDVTIQRAAISSRYSLNDVALRFCLIQFPSSSGMASNVPYLPQAVPGTMGVSVDTAGAAPGSSAHRDDRLSGPALPTAPTSPYVTTPNSARPRSQNSTVGTTPDILVVEPEVTR